MYTDNDKNKMKTFVERLISNPSLATQPQLAIEDNIILFFIQNSPALKATFSTPSYFPDMDWSIVEKMFQDVLFEEIDKKFIPELESLVKTKINFEFMNVILDRQITNEKYQEEMLQFLKKHTSRFEIRRNLESVLKIIRNGLIDKYLNKAFEDRSYTARELSLNERLKMSPDMTANLTKVVMLVSITGLIRSDLNDASLQQKIKIREMEFGNTFAAKEYYEKLITQFTTNLSTITEDLMQKFVSVHLSFNENKRLPATSRMGRIFSIFGKNYNPKAKADKGADTYEKSWFQAQRMNYKFFGFDPDMVNEFYRISAENYW